MTSLVVTDCLERNASMPRLNQEWYENVMQSLTRRVLHPAPVKSILESLPTYYMVRKDMQTSPQGWRQGAFCLAYKCCVAHPAKLSLLHA